MIVLKNCGGNMSAMALLLSNMSAGVGLLEFLVGPPRPSRRARRRACVLTRCYVAQLNPTSGRLSDRFGRLPFIYASALCPPTPPLRERWA